MSAEAESFLPAAPSPRLTAPTTEYVSRRTMPKNALPADYHRARPSDQHSPLTIMLVLTQLAVGAFAVDAFLSFFGVPLAPGRRYHAVLALASAMLALGASLFHLGRPWLAYRALLGIRTSWLSREILAFGAFAGLGTAHAALLWWRPAGILPTLLHTGESSVLSVVVAAVGAIGIGCSVMLYQATGRALWNAVRTTTSFYLTAVILGSAATLLTTMVALDTELVSAVAPLLVIVVAVGVIVKLILEATLLLHLRTIRHPELRRTALLLLGDLAPWTKARVIAAFVGGVVAPGMLWVELSHYGPSATAAVLALVILFVLIYAELVERTLFFTAQASNRMPGMVG